MNREREPCRQRPADRRHATARCAGQMNAAALCRVAHRTPSLQGQSRLRFGRPDRKRGAHLIDIRRRRQVADDEILERRQIRRDAAQQEIDLPRQHGAFAHEGPGVHELFKGGEIRLGLARQTDHRIGFDLEAEQLWIEPRVIAENEAGLLQSPHAPQAGRRRDADPVRQLDVGDPPVGLHFLENTPIDAVELDPAWRFALDVHAWTLPVGALGMPLENKRRTLLRKK